MLIALQLCVRDDRAPTHHSRSEISSLLDEQPSTTTAELKIHCETSSNKHHHHYRWILDAGHWFFYQSTWQFSTSQKRYGILYNIIQTSILSIGIQSNSLHGDQDLKTMRLVIWIVQEQLPSTPISCLSTVNHCTWSCRLTDCMLVLCVTVYTSVFADRGHYGPAQSMQ